MFADCKIMWHIGFVSPIFWSFLVAKSFSQSLHKTKIAACFTWNQFSQTVISIWLWAYCFWQVLIELLQYNEKPISEADGRSCARRIDAITYVECSALTQHNLKQVFDVAVMSALVRRNTTKVRKTRSLSADVASSTVTNGIPEGMSAGAAEFPVPQNSRQHHQAGSQWWKRPFWCCR